MVGKVEIKNIAKELWEKMDESEKFGVKFGLFPYWVLEELRKRGLENRQHEVTTALIDLANSE